MKNATHVVGATRERVELYCVSCDVRITATGTNLTGLRELIDQWHAERHTERGLL